MNHALVSSYAQFLSIHPNYAQNLQKIMRLDDSQTIVIHITSGLLSTKPIDLPKLVSSCDLNYDNLLLIIEPHVPITIYDYRDENFLIMPSRITYLVREYAKLQIIYNQNLPTDIDYKQKIQAFFEPYSQTTFITHNNGGNFVSDELKLVLHGEHAQVNVYGLYLMGDKQQYTCTTMQQHNAAYTTSKVIVKGIVTDAAHVHYEGTVHIDEQAYSIQAHQQNKNIVLNNAARVKSMPRLEVLNNQVQCSHGSAVGYLDQELLRYMHMRGIPLLQAQQLLLEAFAYEPIALIENTNLRIIMHNNMRVRCEQFSKK